MNPPTTHQKFLSFLKFQLEEAFVHNFKDPYTGLE